MFSRNNLTPKIIALYRTPTKKLLIKRRHILTTSEPTTNQKKTFFEEATMRSPPQLKQKIPMHCCYRSNVLLTILLFFCSSVVDVASNLEDFIQEDLCEDLVKQGKCRTEEELMRKYCEKACVKWQQEFSKVEVERVEDPDKFFSLQAKTGSSKTMEFDRFEGYLTMVVNMAMVCSDELNLDEGLKVFEGLHDTWPYALEIVVFPFRHPSIDYSKKDCAKDYATIRKKQQQRHGDKKRIHVMQEIEINGEKTHPVYEFFKTIFSIKELETDMATYFLVNPDGNRAVAHHGASLKQIKTYVAGMLSKDL